MTYTQGGLIQATDYNNFVGTATTAGTINYVWSTGNGQFGYGQSALGQSAASAGVVTATQWASAINTLNSIKTHQSGSGTGIGAPTAGSLVSYLSALSSSIGTVNTNKLLFSAQGSTTTGTVYSPAATAGQDVTYSGTVATRTITFSSGDAARYFFNAGGQINFVITSVANNDATSRSADMATTIATNLGGVSAFRAVTNGGRTGTGGTATTNNTNVGYYGLTTTATTLHQIQSTSATYTNDYVQLRWKSNGVQGANADVGSVITLYVNLYSAHTTYGSGFNDSLNITVNHRIDIVYPETTNLTSSWGTVIVA